MNRAFALSPTPKFGLKTRGGVALAVVLLVLMACAVAMPNKAFATTLDIAQGNIELKDNHKFSQGVLPDMDYQGDLTITGSVAAITNTITISGGSHSIVLDFVNIATSGTSPFTIEAGAGDIIIKLKGANTLTAQSNNCAGLQKKSRSGSKLIITSASGDGSTDGSLIAQGGSYGAGIGGGQGETNADSIEIRGGTIEATGGDCAAGIGGGLWGVGANITISGGVVKATGGDSAGGRTNGAGIGGGGGSGWDGDSYVSGVGGAENVTITDGYVIAKPGDDTDPGSKAAPIGAGDGDTNEVSITGGAFADDSDLANNKIYGITPTSGHIALANVVESEKTAYPSRVYTKADATIEARNSLIYDGSSLETTDLALKLTGTEITEENGFSYRVHNSGAAWAKGLPTKAGSYDLSTSVSPMKINDTWYAASAEALGVIVIDKAPLTFCALDASMAAGTALPKLVWKAEGLVGNDAVIHDPTLAVSGDTSRTGTYAITISGGEVTNADCYDIAYKNATLEVKIAPQPGQNQNSSGKNGDSSGFKLASTGDTTGYFAAIAALLALCATSAIVFVLRASRRR